MLDKAVKFAGAATKSAGPSAMTVTIDYVRGAKHAQRIKAGEAKPARLVMGISADDARALGERLIRRADEMAEKRES